VRAFLAHEDIEPSEEWDEKIIEELTSCDVFVVVLSGESKSSHYVNQEVGFALARGVLFLPLKHPLNPWGFMSSIQGMELETKQVYAKSGIETYVDFHSTAIAMIENIMNREEFHSTIRRSILRGLRKSSNVVETAAKVRLLRTCESFEDAEAEDIVKSVLGNENVSKSFAVPALMKRLWDETPGVFNETRKNDLLKKGVLKLEDLTN